MGNEGESLGMPSIAVVGPGAIGGTLAAWLSVVPGNAVSICARTSFEKLEVETPSGVLSSMPKVFTDASQVTPVDWVLVATKAYHIEGAAQWIERLCGKDTMVAVAQNGVEHIANLKSFVSAERIIPVVIDCPAERQAPGVILQRAPVLMTIPEGENSSRFAALFPEEGFSIVCTNDWTTAAWKKLCNNCGGAVSALLNQPANVVRDPFAADIMRALVRECILVGRAEGVSVDDSIVEDIVASQASAPDGAMNSIHADLVAKRPMEWDARNGVVVRLGQKHGIETPCNAMAANILRTIEANQ
ncbi:MAG: 2-dehydropantoate 2-reductase [Candidatus Pelagisphaera sp.]|jgi:2-dehydropantoate 2-reductase